MPEKLKTNQVAIRIHQLRGSENFIESLENAFKTTDAIIEVEASQYEIKSLEPVYIQIVLELTKITAAYVIGRYALEPLFNWITELNRGWKDALKNRNPLQPINISLKVVGIDLTITTEPYLVSDEWLENYCENIAVILVLFNHDPNLKSVTRIRLLSESVDDIKILTYSNNKQPDYFIDIKAKTVQPIFQQEASYVFPNDTKGLGMLGLADEDMVEAWVRVQLLRAKLNDEILHKLGRR